MYVLSRNVSGIRLHTKPANPGLQVVRSRRTYPKVPRYFALLIRDHYWIKRHWYPSLRRLILQYYYFLHSTSVLWFHIDVVLTLFITMAPIHHIWWYGQHPDDQEYSKYALGQMHVIGHLQYSLTFGSTGTISSHKALHKTYISNCIQPTATSNVGLFTVDWFVVLTLMLLFVVAALCIHHPP